MDKGKYVILRKLLESNRLLITFLEKWEFWKLSIRYYLSLLGEANLKCYADS